MKLLLAFVGEPLAGKETVSKEMARRAQSDGFSVSWIQFRDPLEDILRAINSHRARKYAYESDEYQRMRVDILKSWGIESSVDNIMKLYYLIAREFGTNFEQIETAHRANLQKLSIAMKSDFGDGGLSRAMNSRIRRSTSDLVIIDGVRWLEDEQLVYGIPDSIMMYVTADQEVRIRRAALRSNEIMRTREQLLDDWKKPTEIYIGEIGARVDPQFKIVNNHDSLEQLHREVSSKYKTHIFPRLRVTG